MKQSVLQLKDIHLPGAISSWPLAPGWYILLVLLVLAFLVSAFYLYKYVKFVQKKKLIFAELQRINALYASDAKHAITELSIFLKRLSLSLAPRNQVASLQGKAWLEFLDQKGATNVFSQELQSALLVAPYAKTANVNWPRLIEVARQWIRKNIRHV